MVRTFLLRYYYRYKIYAWVTKKVLEFKENAYKSRYTSTKIIGGVDVTIVKKGHKKLSIRIEHKGISQENSFTYQGIAQEKLWRDIFELSNGYNLMFWSS